MATRGSIEAVFAAAGIETLAVEDGVDIFVAEALQAASAVFWVAGRWD